MHLRTVLAILQKDLRDAVRDGRVLGGLLIPVGLGLLYNVVMPEQQRQGVTLAVASSGSTALPQELRAAVSTAVDLKIANARDGDDVRRRVSSGAAGIGLVLPAGFDAAVAAGQTPALTLVRAGNESFGAAYVASTLDAVLRRLAGQHAPAAVSTELAGSARGGLAPLLRTLGVRKYMVLGSLIMLVAMIAIYLLPVLLTEEAEKRTLTALTMVGSHADVVAAKALVGLTYIGISVPVLLLITGLMPANPALFAAGVLALSVALIGFGLLMGGIVRSMSQLNTWSSLPLLVLIMPVFFIALDLPRWTEWLMGALPGNQALRLLADGLSGQEIYGNWWAAFALLGAWAAVGYALLLRTLSRREA